MKHILLLCLLIIPVSTWAELQLKELDLEVQKTDSVQQACGKTITHLADIIYKLESVAPGERTPGHNTKLEFFKHQLEQEKEYCADQRGK